MERLRALLDLIVVLASSGRRRVGWAIRRVSGFEMPNDYGDGQRFPSAWEEEALASRDTAFDVIDLVISSQDWVHRRKERAEIASPSRVQWHCSLDFTIPYLGRRPTRWFDVGGDGKQVVLVPLDLLSKQPLITFDCRDATGGPVPVLTRKQNGIIAHAAMTHWAVNVAEAAGTSLTQETEDDIGAITSGDGQSALSLLTAITESNEPDKQALAADDGFMQWLQTLAQNFMLIVVLEAKPGDRRILKYSYERQLTPPPLPWREKLALRSTIISLVVPMFRDCESYHFEAVAPEGTNFAWVRLVDSPTEGPVRELDSKDLRESTPHVAHLYLSGASLREGMADRPDPETFTEPVVDLATQLDRTAWQRAAVFVSLFVALFMLGTLPWILGWGPDASTDWCLPEAVPVIDAWCAPSPADGVSADPAALFVGVVGLLSFAVVRQGEHAYTARLVRPLRNLVWINALLPIAGAWLMVFPGPGSLLRAGWAVLGIMAVTGLVILSFGYRESPSDVLPQGPGTVR